MVFDEATSSLDSTTESDVQSSLHAISIGKSSLTIAHRLSTVINSDKILVLKEGRIVESGTHQYLLNLFGEYFKLWQRQTKIQELENSMESLRTAADSDLVHFYVDIDESKHDERGSIN
jgi:ATP-binding cassette subfamily B protein